MKIKLLFVCILTAIYLTSNAQSTVVASSKTSTAKAGNTVAEAETAKSFAFSMTFKEEQLQKVKILIINEFPSFNGHLATTKTHEIESKIELRNDNLKIEYKSDSDSPKAINAKKKLQALAEKLRGI